MQRIDQRLVVSPTDPTKHQERHDLMWLDLQGADRGLATSTAEPDEALDLIFKLGLAHEHRYLESLRAAGKEIRGIPTSFDAEGRRAAEAATVEAMRACVDVVYQATLFEGSER